jgi:glutathione S-transferase
MATPMTTTTLTYFNFNGRAFAIRAALRYAKYDFVDSRLKSFGLLNELRGPAGFNKAVPLGSLPVLNLSDGQTFVQSVALANWAAKKSDLYPKDGSDEDQLLVEETMETANEWMSKIPQHSDPVEKKKLREEFLEKVFPRYANFFVEKLSRSKVNGPYLLGKRFSIADIYVFNILNIFVSGNTDHIHKEIFQQQYPIIHQYWVTVNQHPIVRAELDAKF